VADLRPALPATIDAEQTAMNSVMRDLGITPAMLSYIKTAAAKHIVVRGTPQGSATFNFTE
jgi:hypothetical protein